MWEPLLLLVPPIILLGITVAAFVFLPVWVGVVAAVVCVLVAGWALRALGGVRFV